MISGHPIFTGFRRLTGCQRDPRDRGVTYYHFEIQNQRVFSLDLCMKLDYDLHVCTENKNIYKSSSTCIQIITNSVNKKL